MIKVQSSLAYKMDILNKLNPQQLKAVTSTASQILVLAGPGSGKTRVLTQRIAYLVYEKHVNPRNILAVTFTNKAAREMRERLERMLGNGVSALWLGTFHAICARILRRESEMLPFDANYVIMDADDQKSIVKRVLKDLNLDDKLYPPNAMHAIISNAKNQLTSAVDFSARTYREEVAKRIYERYESTLRSSNAVDFDDLLLWTVKLFKEHSNIRKRYSQRFEHVLIDEFQDTNQAQYDLVKYFASYHHSLFAVGDEDQSIYRWRGADYRNIIHFEKEYPKTSKLLLERNYRSTQNILDAAQAVINQNTTRTPKKLFSRHGSGNSITLYDAVDDHAEAEYVVGDILERIAAGKDGGDFAVMYRTNAQSRLFEEAFLRSGIPYRLVGAQRFYGRREVKDIVTFLRLIHNPLDTISLNRTINLPPRGIGSKTRINLNLAAQENAVFPSDVLLSLGKKKQESPYWEFFSARSATALAHFGALLANWRKINQTHSLPELFDQVIKDIGYKAYIDDGTDIGEGRWENILELRQLTYDFEDQGMTEFLETIALVSDQDTVPDAPNAPTLLTLHAAKGLEFSTVYIVGLDEGLLPHNRSFEDPEEMAEERRLFYVGITRAKNDLILTRAGQRSNFGRYEYTMPSRFLDDIPEKLIKQEGIRLGVHSVKPLSPPRWTSTISVSKNTQPVLKKPEEMAYKAGMHIIHPTWGNGMVIETRAMGNDETVTVMFETVGLKRLAASIAKLEIVK
ncbi:MAG: UvrD-helicase domain-containing protein [Anaerolineaceae bacterium]|nr:UvrD-helicase domain-containing protein [Anaerolineaceae bacterium]